MSTMSVSPFSDLNVSLSRRVAEALLSADPQAFSRLNVTARGDVVFLNGTLNDVARRDKAMTVTQGMTGVAQVVDHLHVRPDQTPPRSALDVPLTTALPGEPWWQRAVVPAAILLIAGIVIGQFRSIWNGPAAWQDAHLVAVEGSVFFEGEPATGASLIFHPLDTADALLGRPTADADEDGNFTVQVGDGVEGAPPGRYVVTVRWHPYVIRGEDYVPGDNVIPERYGDPRTSPLIVEVAPSATSIQLPAFDLAKCPDAATAVR